MKVVGVDGCRGGWVAMCWDVEQGTITPEIHKTLAGLIDHYDDADAIGIDMPIGLSDTGTRQCDKEARQVLGRKRAPAVFPPPIRDILHVATHKEADRLSRAKIGKGIPIQSFSIFPKIAEANDTVTAEVQDWVFEVHPEVSFWALAGSPMTYRKGKQAGFDERRNLLEQATGLSIPTRIKAFKLRRPAKPDDLLDAMVAAWTAKRVVDGVAGRLPNVPESDSCGLRMEIVY
jgi:predicted RNase H-like nuclease